MVAQVYFKGCGVVAQVYFRAAGGPRPHLQAGDGESPRAVRQRGDGDDERRVGDVLVVELDGHLVVAWGTREGSGPRFVSAVEVYYSQYSIYYS